MKLHVIIEQDEDGYFTATVPALTSCYTQARTLDDLHERLKEVVALCLEEEKPQPIKFVSVEEIEVAA